MKTIMVATDFSERSERALGRATLLARQTGAALALVHVVDDDQPARIVEAEREVAADLLREQADTLRDTDGVACTARVILDDPFAGIVAAASEIAPDLLVLGPHRRRPLRDVFVGTTAERTIHSVTCPVLMVNAPAVRPYGQVMLTTDLSEAAARAANACAGLGIARGAEIAILHLFNAPAVKLAMGHTLPTDSVKDYLDDQKQEASRNLAAFVKSLEWRSIRQDVRQARSSSAEDILTAAREGSADLIVVGTQGRTGLARFLLGSVAEAVLRGADRDVLAVPPGSA